MTIKRLSTGVVVLALAALSVGCSSTTDDAGPGTPTSQNEETR